MKRFWGMASVGFVALLGCEGARQPVSEGFGLTEDQCSHFEVNGKVQICHATGSATHPYTILKTSLNGCINGHTHHEGDYIAVNDPTCQGGGCLPEAAPCDDTVPCCEGATCEAGVCTAQRTCDDSARCFESGCSCADQNQAVTISFACGELGGGHRDVTLESCTECFCEALCPEVCGAGSVYIGPAYNDICMAVSEDIHLQAGCFYFGQCNCTAVAP